MVKIDKNKVLLHKLQQKGIFIPNDHFEFTSRKHGDTYINKDAIYPHTELVSEVCRNIAEVFKNEAVRAVIAPATGGIVMSQWVSYWLRKLTNSEVVACYADKKSKSGFIIKRGYGKLIAGKNTLVLEDIINTGGTVKKVLEETKAKKARIVGVGCIWNRGGIKPANLGVNKLYSLIGIRLSLFTPANCKLCLRKIPLRKGIG